MEMKPCAATAGEAPAVAQEAAENVEISIVTEPACLDPLGSKWIGPAYAGKRLKPEAAIETLVSADCDLQIAGQMEQFSPKDAKLKRLKAAEDKQRAQLSLNPALWPEVGELKAGLGGELVERHGDPLTTDHHIVDTVTGSPDMLTAAASLQRLDLSKGADALALSVDVNESIQARNSLERMLGQQIAACYALGMRMMGKINGELSTLPSNRAVAEWQQRSIELNRMTGSAARMFASFQDGLLTLQRMRTGGKQKVKVTHIHQQVAVADGGKAVVAGSIRPKGRGRAKPKTRGAKPRGTKQK
jgi:hypothetical protein